MSMSEGSVQVERRAGVGWIIFDRPPLNVVNASMARAARKGIEQLDADDSSRVIVLTSVGDKAFAAGADVGEHRLDQVRELNDELFALVDTLMKPDGKPRIAAVKGICSGGGNEVAFACDFVVARSDTRFSQPEVKLGAVGNLGAYLMAQVIAPGKALELALTGDWLNAEEALSFGLITRILPQEDYENALNRYLERFTDKSIAALRVGRGQFRRLMGMSVAEGLRVLPDYFMDESIQLEDYQEGVEAFMAKRKPVWRHR
ncbi:MAG: enoyl-CoA hydratase/isomerase family protein [Steroidobacteraceae bacterium]